MKREIDKKRYADEGEVWVCAACGKYQHGDKYDFPDASCMLNAVLCHDNLKLDENGKLLPGGATLIEEKENE